MRLEDEIKQTNFKNPYQKLALNLMVTGSWMNAQGVRALKPFGLSPQQYNILRILRGQRPDAVTVQVIKERMIDKMSNVSRLVEKLRLKGLVDRSICPDDRRAVNVRITDAGMAQLAEIDAQESEWHMRLKALDEDEVATLNALLDKVRG